MTSRAIEARIILLIWLFSASVVSCSTVGIALAIRSDVGELIGIHGDRSGETVVPQDVSNSSQPSELEGDA
jgi:hypothetical protein